MIKKLFYLLLLISMIVACKKSEPGNPNNEVKVEINSIQPKDPKPGDIVTISGKGFGTVVADISLTIGSAKISINTLSETEIRFTLPSGIAEGLLALKVREIAAIINDAQGAKISPKPADQPVPTFQSLDANKGKAGDVVTLTGTNFSPVISENKVIFTGNNSGAGVVAVVKSASTTSLRVEVPAQVATGLVSIEVKGVTAVRAANFNGIFTLEVGGQTGGFGTITYFDKLKTHLYFAANDNQGNFFSLNPTGPSHYFYNVIRINAAGTISKTFEPSDFVSGATKLFINGMTNDADGTIWVVAGLSRTTPGKLYKILKNTDSPVFVKDITGGELLGLDVSQHFFDFVINSKREVFFIDANYKIYNLNADGKIQMFINPWDLVNDGSLSAIGLSFDAQDNLFFTAVNGSRGINRIYKVSPAKVITPLYQATEYGFADGALAQSKFQQLGSIAVDQSGSTLYIADGRGSRLRKLDLALGNVTTLAGTGNPITTSSKLEGAALETAIAPAKISLSEARKEVYLQNVNDNIYQVYRY